MDKGKTIFTWKKSSFVECYYPRKKCYFELTADHWFSEHKLGLEKSRPQNFCPYCTSTSIDIEELPDHGTIKDKGFKYNFIEKHTCCCCGFWCVITVWEAAAHDDKHEGIQRAVLQNFNINDASLEFNEIGSHLKKNYSDIFSLTPRNFEKLVADVYKNLGYEVRLTPETHDGGCDIILLERNTGDQILVECKRYSKHRKVGIDLTRNLCGVMVENQEKKSILVSTSRFTSGAEKYAKDLPSKLEGFSMNLEQAERLLKNVGAYNLNLPLESVYSELRNNDNDWTSKLLERVTKSISDRQVQTFVGDTLVWPR